MKFATKDLCERLQKLGCVSESGFYWLCSTRISVAVPEGSNISNLFSLEEISSIGPPIPAFLPQDFIGPTERARENCRIVFGDKCPDMCGCRSGDGDRPHNWVWQDHRHKLIELETEAEFWALIEYAIKETA